MSRIPQLVLALHQAEALLRQLRDDDPEPFDVEVVATSADFASITLRFSTYFGADVLAVDMLAARLRVLPVPSTRPDVTWWRNVDELGNVVALVHVEQQEVPACKPSPSSG